MHKNPVVDQPLLYSDDGEEEQEETGGSRRDPAEQRGDGHPQEEEYAVLVAYLGSRSSGSPLADGDGSTEAVVRRHKLLQQSAARLLERLCLRSVALDSKQGEIGVRTSLLSLRREHRLQQLKGWAIHSTERSLLPMGMQLKVAFGLPPLLLLPLSPFFS